MIIDLQSARANREAPDRDCTSTDSFGRPMYLFGLEYRIDGRTWSVMLEAYSLDDAVRRVAAMREGLQIYGQIYRSVSD